jgi:hypothetical protein
MQAEVFNYLSAGLSLIPTHPILKNPRVDSWTIFQKDLPTAEQVKKWFFDGHDYSPAIITGKVSGNLEMLDFDERARQFQQWKELVQWIDLYNRQRRMAAYTSFINAPM